MHTSTHELAQRISDQQATIARLRVERDKLRTENELVKDQVLTLASHAGVLWGALENVLNMYPDCPPAIAALADPSLQVDALAAVLGLMDKWQETAFKSDWESVDEDLFAAWDAYRAVTHGDGGAE